ncbi:MAG: asparagine synthase (glutamine-hydrolyzing) [Acidobacteriota bacterium]|nr:asparagine synthase (glutamine-hydrolyzing) [Acidobacteriota bacterium]
MCGIVGIYSYQSELENREQALLRMQRAIEHRGPDDSGQYFSADGKVALAHTRLAILDLSPAGRQPMATADGRYWITFNGEIYNFRELRRQLEQAGETFTTQTDTEIILRLYARYGADCLQHLRGMFALAIWDVQTQKLFMARDRLGIKPLYYYAGAGVVLFASEVRALLASELVPKRLNPMALDQYLTYQSIPAPATLIQDVRALPPGTWMMVDASGAVEQHKYWDLLPQQAAITDAESEPATLRRVGELLRESVELHLVSDVPVGVFLSGGIDSSAIVALMNEQGHTAHTFSVIFADSNYDESVYARQVAERFRTDHTEIHLTEGEMLSQLPAALAAMDQPTGDGINTYVVSQAVKNAGVKVALSGLGGDELFAGYDSFLRLEKATRYWRSLVHVPAAVRHLAAQAVELAGGRSIQAAKLAAMLETDGSLAQMYPITRQVLSSTKRQALFSTQWRAQFEPSPDPYTALLHQAYQQAGGAGLLAQISYAEGRTYMHDVLLRDTDQMSMAHALEVRVPLLDHKLVEYVMRVPDIYKRPNGLPKPLLVASLNGLLPDDIVHRPKQGFTLPFANWMRGELREFCEARLHPQRIASRGIFDAKEVSRLWRLFLNGSKEVSWSRLWVLVALEEWLERNQIFYGF